MFRAVTILITLMFSHAGLAMAAPLAGDTMTDSATGMEFVWVPSGCFDIGDMSKAKKAPSVQAAVSSDQQLIIHEGPGTEFVHENASIDAVHEIDAAMSDAQSGSVCHQKGFWMGKFEVTQAQFKNITGENPSGFKKGGNYPVERVRWFDALIFIRQLNKATGKHYRLPSEAEWEYAARSGGKKQRYGAGNSAAKSAWYMRNSGNTSHPVGEKQANGLGLHDMSGNVWEWTNDCWNEDVSSVPADGSANKNGNCGVRVLRGGSWYDSGTLITTTARLWNDTDKFDNNSGFRLVHD